MTEVEPDPHSPILITGGTGSFGSALARFLLAETQHRIRLYSRDEYKQSQLQAELPTGPRITYILGDVRDLRNLELAAAGCSAIVHAAALKQAPTGERAADEFLLTNANGSHNVVRAAIAASVPRTLLISSDKACDPINHYGVTKRAAEGLFIQGNSLGGGRGCRFASVRGGNVWASRGSVARIWHGAVRAGQPLIVNGDTTRFHLEMDAWVRFAWRALSEMHGGEIFIPRARAWALHDLAHAFNAPYQLTGPRPGDKTAEVLYSADEAGRVVDSGWAYVLEPAAAYRSVWNYQPWAGVPVVPGAYSSATAPRLSLDELRTLVGAL